MKINSGVKIAPDYRISRIIKGGWHLAGGHGEIDRSKAIDDMATFVESGITTFDCADIYTGVEELIGDFRRAYPELAKRIQVHTKFVPDYDKLQTLEPAYIETIIDRSRSRLGVDALDLVQFHWWDTNVKKYVQTALELKRLRDAGKIRHIGLTNFNTACTNEILEAGVPLISTQVQYSVLDNRPTRALGDFCARHGIALLCYGSLAGGFLSNDWFRKLEPTGVFENRSHAKYKLMIDDFGGWDLFQELLGTLEGIAQIHGVSIGQIASSWTLHQPGVAAVIVGATSTRHLTQNLRIPNIQLSSHDLEAIRRITDQRSGPHGDVYDLERDKDGRHGRIMKYNLNEDKA